MLSKSLVQFSVEMRGCVPSLLFSLRPNYGRGNEGNDNLFKRTCAPTVVFSPSDPAAGHCRSKSRGTTDQIATCWITEKAREFQENIYFCCIDYDKDFDCVDHDKLENSSRDGSTRPPDLPPEKSVCRSRSNS